METNVSFDANNKKYDKKETQIQLNLISKTKVEPPKMVGRINIDLALILNEKIYKNPT